MTRAKGIELISRYDHSCDPKYITSFCDYIDLSVDEFWAQVLQSVNRDLFHVAKDGTITRKFEVGVGL